MPIFHFMPVFANNPLGKRHLRCATFLFGDGTSGNKFFNVGGANWWGKTVFV
jgi:hypothetical protein